MFADMHKLISGLLLGSWRWQNCLPFLLLFHGFGNALIRNQVCGVTAVVRRPLYLFFSYRLSNTSIIQCIYIKPTDSLIFIFVVNFACMYFFTRLRK